MENQNNTQNVEYVDEGISLQDLLMIIMTTTKEYLLLKK